MNYSTSNKNSGIITAAILWLLCLGCTSAYKDLRPLPNTSNCILKFKPSFHADWYTTSVDVYGKHISGLLLFKTMPDSAIRIVFTNEAGISFFDFEFRRDGKFLVHQIIGALNKKVVVNLLRKDFETVLMQGVTTTPLNGFMRKDEFFYAYNGKRGKDYFITDKDCASLLRIEKASKRAKMTEIRLIGIQQGAPDSVYLKHFTFDMQITLKKLQR